jgi:thioredoxin 1
MSEPITLTDDNFSAEVLYSDVPVLVDFWATWCGPCRMIAPIVKELSGEYEGKAKVCKLDVDSAQKTAAEFGIRPNQLDNEASIFSVICCLWTAPIN